MFEKLKNRLADKVHVIVLVIITIYLVALTIKTADVFYHEYWLKRSPAESSQVKK